MTDLKKIEQGEEINGQYIKDSLVFIIGDNLGSHSLGGFNKKFSISQYFCRFCLITRNDFYNADGAFNIYTERTIESYNDVVNKIKIQKDYQGIKFSSIFNY